MMLEQILAQFGWERRPPTRPPREAPDTDCTYRLTDKALEELHGPERCQRCGGRGWVPVKDPLYPGALIDARCPRCVRTARAIAAAENR